MPNAEEVLEEGPGGDRNTSVKLRKAFDRTDCRSSMIVVYKPLGSDEWTYSHANMARGDLLWVAEHIRMLAMEGIRMGDE